MKLKNMENYIKSGLGYTNMTDELWEEVEKEGFFTRWENWGDPYKVKIKEVYLLNVLRLLIFRPLIINCAYELSGHVDYSYHGLGMATDIHSPGMGAEDLFDNAIRLEFTGIGLYPHWNRPGLHVDVRQLRLGEMKHLWRRTADGIYLPITIRVKDMPRMR